MKYLQFTIPEYPTWVLVQDHCVRFWFVHELPTVSQKTVDQYFTITVHSNELLTPKFPLNPLLLPLSKLILTRKCSSNSDKKWFSTKTHLLHFTDQASSYNLTHIKYFKNIDNRLGVCSRKPATRNQFDFDKLRWHHWVTRCQIFKGDKWQMKY